MTEIDNYIRARTVEEVFQRLNAEKASTTRFLSGGTDLLLKLKRDTTPFVSLIDISDIPELMGIEVDQQGIRIGAGTKLADVAQCKDLDGPLNILAYGASQVGSVQIRNLASIGGNICNAAPSADTATPLVALDAEVEIISASSHRRIKVTEFFKGPGKTTLESGELLSAIWIPKPIQKSAGVYIKHATRGAMDLAMVGVAVVLWEKDGQIDGRLVYGAVAPTPIRAFKAEAQLKGLREVDEANLETVAAVAAEEVKPISDVRASAQYRKDMAYQLTKRAITQAYQALLKL